MFINFWYIADESKNVTGEPMGIRMLGQDFVLFRRAYRYRSGFPQHCVYQRKYPRVARCVARNRSMPSE